MALPRKPRLNPETPVAPEAPAAQEAPKPLKLLATGWSLLEPHENIWFTAGKPREVYRVTKWMQAQIDAGLLKEV